MKEGHKQLPLGLALRDDCTLEGYYPGDNQEVLLMLQRMAQNQGEQFIFLWGRAGVGKTHLLQGTCHFASKFNHSALYIPLARWLKEQKPSDLEGVERVGLICIDDMHLVRSPEWQEALFHLYNRVRALNHRLIITADVAPKSLDLSLADLQSRLAWGITYPLHALDDEQLIAALQLRAKQRGLDLPQEVGVYLLRRYPRSMPLLYDLLDQLDTASLAAQRRLTVPFVKETLKISH